MGAVVSLVFRDLKRQWRERVRLVVGLVQPLTYLFFIGAGIGPMTRLGGAEYQRFIFPGVLCLTMLFAASVNGVGIIFDRERGFLKAVLVAPVSRLSIVLGKVSSGALLALLQGGLM